MHANCHAFTALALHQTEAGSGFLLKPAGAWRVSEPRDPVGQARSFCIGGLELNALIRIWEKMEHIFKPDGPNAGL